MHSFAHSTIQSPFHLHTCMRLSIRWNWRQRERLLDTCRMNNVEEIGKILISALIHVRNQSTRHYPAVMFVGCSFYTTSFNYVGLITVTQWMHSNYWRDLVYLLLESGASRFDHILGNLEHNAVIESVMNAQGLYNFIISYRDSSPLTGLSIRYHLPAIVIW